MQELIKNPFVSIIVPVYNVEKHIGRTIQSLLDQTNKDFEVVFVDDGSPDNSVRVIEEMLENAPFLYRIIHQENRGSGEARNTGVSAAQGKWVMFLDSDDLIQPFAVELCCWLIEQTPDADVVFTRFQNVDEANSFAAGNKSEAFQIRDRKTLLHGFLTRRCVYLVPGTAYRTDFLRDNGIYNPAIRWSEDQYFMWRVLNVVEKAVCSDAVLYNYVHHAGESIMRVTPVERMLEAYVSYQGLVEKIDDDQVQKFLLARWCLGCLHVFSNRRDRASFDRFWNAVQFSEKCSELLTFPDKRVNLLAFSGLVNKRLLYWLMK